MPEDVEVGAGDEVELEVTAGGVEEHLLCGTDEGMVGSLMTSSEVWTVQSWR